MKQILTNWMSLGGWLRETAISEGTGLTRIGLRYDNFHSPSWNVLFHSFLQFLLTFLSPYLLLIACSYVFLISIATVMGPTPPGTGVMKPATSLAASKSTSPNNLFFFPGSELGSTLIPQSITIAPGLIQSPETIREVSTSVSITFLWI